MDYTMRLVYETEGRHGGDIRGWNGEAARQEAERQEYEQMMREMDEANRLRGWRRDRVAESEFDRDDPWAD